MSCHVSFLSVHALHGMQLEPSLKPCNNKLRSRISIWDSSTKQELSITTAEQCQRPHACFSACTKFETSSRHHQLSVSFKQAAREGPRACKAIFEVLMVPFDICRKVSHASLTTVQPTVATTTPAGLEYLIGASSASEALETNPKDFFLLWAYGSALGLWICVQS